MNQADSPTDPPREPTKLKPASTVPGDTGIYLETSDFLLNEQPPASFVKSTTRYEILSELGRGGMGIIYRAQDWQLHRHVAVKILRPEFIDRPKLIARFLDEARIMGTLQHPGIAHVYDCGHCEDGRPFHAMMLVEGETFCSLMKNQTPSKFATARWLSIFARACHTVAYTHSRDVAHLDLKPANIMVGEYGEVYLMDWGLAQLQQASDSDLDDTNPYLGDSDPNPPGASLKKVQGTLEYMSPEQARGEKLDQRTDVFCLGAILYEILTGFTIYSGDNREKLRRLATKADLSKAFEILDRSSDIYSLNRLTKQCLAADPRDRPANATLLSNEMSDHQASRLEVVEHDMTRFFELSLDLFCIAGFDGYFRRINSNFSRVLGYSENQLLSRPFIEFVHVDDREKTKQIMGVLLNGQPVVRFCNRYLAANGQFVEFEWTAKSMLEDNMIFAVARNLSESIRSENIR
jgi:serine/threonine-protein kinase